MINSTSQQINAKDGVKSEEMQFHQAETVRRGMEKYYVWGGQRAGVTNRRKCCEWNTFHHCKFIECHGGASWANNSGGG